MSEFQSVHFMAIDRPLDDEQLEFMRKQSTRAEVTRWEFFNEYHYGDFHGDPAKMLQRGYDVHLHYANFGIRKLMIRLPGGPPCDAKMLKQYLVGRRLSWQKSEKGPGGIWCVQPDSEAGSYHAELYNVDELFQQIAPLRAMLIAGDLRPIYLAWLACAGDDDREPPVPAGLTKLTPPLEAMAQFYELNGDLLAAAAENSSAAPAPARDDTVEVWLSQQPLAELRDLAARLLGDRAADCRAEVLAGIRNETPPKWPVAESTRTLGRLRERAVQLQQLRLDREERAREAARHKRLASMAANPGKAVAEIEALIEMRSTAKYGQAAQVLADLREALGPKSGPQQARAIAARIRLDNPKRSGLVAALRQHGLVD